MNGFFDSLLPSAHLTKFKHVKIIVIFTNIKAFYTKKTESAFPARKLGPGSHRMSKRKQIMNTIKKLFAFDSLLCSTCLSSTTPGVVALTFFPCSLSDYSGGAIVGPLVVVPSCRPKSSLM